MAPAIPQRGLQPNWTSKNICIALSKNWQKVLLLAEDHGKKTADEIVNPNFSKDFVGIVAMTCVCLR